MQTSIDEVPFFLGDVEHPENLPFVLGLCLTSAHKLSLSHFDRSLLPPPSLFILAFITLLSKHLVSLLPPFLSCVSQNDSVAESNEDVPPESLNTLLTDISLVSLASRRSPCFGLIKMDVTQGRNEEGWEEKRERRGWDGDVADL